MSKHVVDGLALIAAHMREETGKGNLGITDRKTLLDLEEATDYLDRLVSWYRKKRG